MARYGYGYDDGYGYGGWAPYVSVAERRRRAMRKMAALRKKGVDVQPVTIDGRKIAKSFWGEAWCDHLESFSDFENRLPRGRTYVRNGSVCHLAMAKGSIQAKVSGSELYDVHVKIKTLPGPKWKSLKQRCGGQIGSLLELLQGRLSDHVMEVVTHRQEGLFPLPGEMTFTCSCPDWARMCKHVAAVLYGVGARLDNKPELLFALRGVNHEELIEADAEKAVTEATSRGKSKRLAVAALGEVFGIDLGEGPASDSSEPVAKNGKPRRDARLRTVAVDPNEATVADNEKPRRDVNAPPKRRSTAKMAKTKKTKTKTTKTKKKTPRKTTTATKSTKKAAKKVTKKAAKKSTTKVAKKTAKTKPIKKKTGKKTGKQPDGIIPARSKKTPKSRKKAKATATATAEAGQKKSKSAKKGRGKPC